MMDNFNHVLLFKTNLNCEEDRHILHKILGGHQEIEKWNLDLNDEDCVLRIVSPTLTHQDIIDLIVHYRYHCQILT